MLDDRTGICRSKRHRHDIDPHLTILQPVAADVRVGQFGDPPLLLQTDGFGRMSVGRVAPRTHLDKHHRAAVEGDEIDVAAQHPFTSAHDPVAQTTEKLLSFCLSTLPEGLPWIPR